MLTVFSKAVLFRRMFVLFGRIDGGHATVFSHRPTRATAAVVVVARFLSW